MNCLVCKKEFEGEKCPRCKFPVIHFPGNMEEGIKSIQPTVNQYRSDFLKSISIGVQTYSWKDQEGMLVLDETRIVSFGTADVLQKNPVFLGEQFARIKERQALTLKTIVKIGEDQRELSVEVPNLFEAELQQIGIEVTNDFRFRLLLRNAAGNVSTSGYQEIFV